MCSGSVCFYYGLENNMEERNIAFSTAFCFLLLSQQVALLACFVVFKTTDIIFYDKQCLLLDALILVTHVPWTDVRQCLDIHSEVTKKQPVWPYGSHCSQMQQAFAPIAGVLRFRVSNILLRRAIEQFFFFMGTDRQPVGDPTIVCL